MTVDELYDIVYALTQIVAKLEARIEELEDRGECCK